MERLFHDITPRLKTETRFSPAFPQRARSQGSRWVALAVTMEMYTRGRDTRGFRLENVFILLPFSYEVNQKVLSSQLIKDFEEASILGPFLGTRFMKCKR